MLLRVLHVLSLLSRNVFTFQPYGPKMCSARCQSLLNCNYFIYDEAQLKCQLVFNSSALNLHDDRSTKRDIEVSGVSNIHLCQDGNSSTISRVKEDEFTIPDSCFPKTVDKFHEACVEGNLVEVKRLVCQGMVDVNCREQFGSTAVMIAAEMKQEHIFDFLVQQNSDLSVIDENSFTNVLHYACVGGSAYIVRKLLHDHNMDIDLMNGDDVSPLVLALHEGHLSVVKVLLDRGANFTPNDYRDSILHEACVGGSPDMVKYILSLNITDINSKGYGGKTPLMYAVIKGQIQAVKLLIERGADVNTVDDAGNNILHNAYMSGCVEMMIYILSINVTDIDRKGQSGRTPLLLCVLRGKLRFVKLLKIKGADLTALDENRNNILHLACESGKTYMVKYVLALNVCDIEARERRGRTPIMIAVDHSLKRVVKCLYKHHNASITKTDEHASNVLHLACRQGNLGMFKYLITISEIRGLQRGKDKNGLTPLDLARKKGLYDIVSLFKGQVK